MKAIKPDKVKSFYPRYVWDSRGKEKIDYKTNWITSNVWWIDEVESFTIIFPGLVKVRWKTPDFTGDSFAIYEAKIELK